MEYLLRAIEGKWISAHDLRPAAHFLLVPFLLFRPRPGVGTPALQRRYRVVLLSVSSLLLKDFFEPSELL